MRALWAAAACALIGAAAAWSWCRGSARFGFTRLVFEYELAENASELDRQASSGSSAMYYFTSYYLDGILSAFEATRDERLLKRALALMDAMIAASRPLDRDGREYRVWGPFSVTSDSPVPRPSLRYNLQAAVPLARAAAIIRADPRLRARYGDAARRYAGFVDGCVIGYFYGVELSSQVPWLDADRFPIWSDDASNLALDAAFLCRATARPATCALAARIGEGFKAKLRPYKSGWIWENQTIPIGSGNEAGVPDLSDTNREALLMATLHEMGLVFSRSDIDRMAATLADTVWNGSVEDPSFANYLNGSNAPYRVYTQPGLNGSVYHGWALMGAYSPKAETALFAALEAVVRGKRNPSLERNSKSYGGLLALAGHLLRNQAMISACPPPRRSPSS